MNIKEIINEAASRLNEPEIEDVFSTINNQARMYLSRANKMARDIAKRYEWSSLINPIDFTTVIDVQEYMLPSDFKGIVTNNIYNYTQQRTIERETPDSAEQYISFGNTSWTDTKYRIIKNKMRFTVPADSEDVIRYEYKSNSISIDDLDCNDSFQSNTSEFILDDEALIKGIVFDISRKYGFSDAQYLREEYESEINDLKSKDGGKFVITPSGMNTKIAPYPTNWNTTG